MPTTEFEALNPAVRRLWYQHLTKFHPWNAQGNAVSGNAYGFPMINFMTPRSNALAPIQDYGAYPLGNLPGFMDGTQQSYWPLKWYPPKAFRAVVTPDHWDSDELIRGDVNTQRFIRGLCGEHILYRCCNAEYANFNQAAYDWSAGGNYAAVWRTAIFRPQFTFDSWNDFELDLDALTVIAGPAVETDGSVLEYPVMDYPFSWVPNPRISITLSYNYPHTIQGQFDNFPNWRHWTVATDGPWEYFDNSWPLYHVWLSGVYENNARTVESVFSTGGEERLLSNSQPTCFCYPRWSRQSDEYMALYAPHSIVLEPIG